MAEKLTPREAEVLRLLAWGYTRKDIADRLGIGARTVEFHQTSGMRRLGVETRRELMAFAVSEGWMVTPP